MKIWKIHCEEDLYPGLWRKWFLNQCVAVGWPAKKGYKLKGKSVKRSGWIAARRALEKIEIGDKIVVTLKKNRIARIGEVVKKNIDDHLWNPLVPKAPDRPFGEKGRRILVRWDLALGPTDQEMVVLLPKIFRFKGSELRRTISEIKSISVPKLNSLMEDENNWVGLWARFASEKALSDYISLFPDHLRDGLSPHPDKKIRENVFHDRSRSDVLLVDEKGTPIIVECKQSAPDIAHLIQLRKYLKNYEKMTGRRARGILIHGGSTNLSSKVRRESNRNPRIDLVQYKLDVRFTAIR